jgi:hypothetical protein
MARLICLVCDEVDDGLVARALLYVDVVRLLLARKGVEVNKSLADGAMALFIASNSGHVEVVRLLDLRRKAP